MSFSCSPRRLHLAVLVIAALTTACDAVPPFAPQGQPLVVTGRVLSVTSDGGAAAASSSSSSTDGSSLDGIEVSAEGSAATTFTDVEGGFRLEVEMEGDRLVIRFRRGSVDARIELEGLSAGATLHLEVRLSGSGGAAVRRDDAPDFDIEGQVALVAVEGEAPTRTLRVELSAHGHVSRVDIDESGTRFESDGDVHTVGALLSALERSDVTVRLQGEAVLLEDETALATSIKVETDETGDDGGEDDAAASFVEFKGAASLLAVSGEAPSRVVRLRVVGDATWEASLVEGGTAFDASGDLRTVGELVLALSSAADVRVEGRGSARQDGSVLAVAARADFHD